MAIPRVRTIIREDVPGAPDWIEALLTLLNRGFADVSNVLEHGLTVSDNQLAELKTITVKMPDEFPTWHVVGASGEPPFQNGMGNWAAAFLPMGFRMLPDGFVELCGFGKTGGTAPVAYTNVFQMPPGYGPRLVRRFSSQHAGGDVAIHVDPNGTIQLAEATPAVAANSWFQLDGIRYQANAVAAKADTFAKPFPIAISTSGRFPIADCRAMRVIDRTNKSRGVLGPCDVIWEPNGTGLTLNAIWGLQPGRTYGIDLLLSAG